MDADELHILLEAQELVEAGAAEWVTSTGPAAVESGGWECPCGREEPKPGAQTVPVRTLVSLREPRCPFCSRSYEERIEVP